ncbi:MAG: hypothetical protein WAS72_09830 [Saprospiraceae bacterium]
MSLNVSNASNNSTFFVGACGGNETFDNLVIRNSYSTSDTLISALKLNYAIQYTFEGGDKKINAGYLYYRIYIPNSTAPSFKVLNLSDIDAYSSDGYYTNKTFSSTTDINLLAGLSPSTTYLFEVYFAAEVDTNFVVGNPSVIDTTIMNNNNGANYIARFTTAASLLPVSLINYTAQLKNNVVSLNWITESEHNNDFYTIEKSQDGLVWGNIGKMNGYKNSTQIRQYFFEDVQLQHGVTYYRLSQTDTDGTKKILGTRTVTLDKEIKTVVFPNPTADFVQLTFPIDNGSSEYFIQMFDFYGHKLYESTITKTVTTLDLTAYDATQIALFVVDQYGKKVAENIIVKTSAQ